MTDRELLINAAKAAGAEFEVSDEEGVYLHQPIGGVAGSWNPLNDDGDALRLAVKLEISLAMNQPVGGVEAQHDRTTHERPP